MANLFYNFNIPVGDGAGTALDVSAMGIEKTITLAGTLGGAMVSIEAFQGAEWVAVGSFQGVGTKKFDVAASQMRVVISGYTTATSGLNCDVAANDNGISVVAIPLPAGNGVGTAVSIANMGEFSTVLVGGTFNAGISFEISEDGTDYVDATKVFTSEGHVSKRITANFIRAKVSSLLGSLASVSCSIGSENPGTGAEAGGPLTGTAVVQYWLDPVDGDDGNTGLDVNSPLLTMSEFYRRVGDSINSVVGANTGIRLNFINNSANQVDVDSDLWLVGAGGSYTSNPISYHGPEMILAVPSSGPATAALDGTPAVVVDNAGAPSATGRATRLDFTGAAPGWAVDNLRQYFLRVTRAGSKVFWEIPISKNTADTITVDTLNIVGTLLSTDTVEIVRPAVRIREGTYSTTPIGGGTGAATYIFNALPNDMGCTFVRLATGDINAMLCNVKFDRCHLSQNANAGCQFHHCSVHFTNCIARHYINFYGQTSRSHPGYSGDAPIDADPRVCLVFRGTSGGKLVIGGAYSGLAFGTGLFSAEDPIAFYGSSGLAVGAGGVFDTNSVIAGSVSGLGVLACNGGRIHLSGGDDLTLDGATGDLKVGVGAAIDKGTAAGAFEEVAGYNGIFTRILEGTAAAPYGDDAIITTAPLFKA